MKHQGAWRNRYLIQGYSVGDRNPIFKEMDIRSYPFKWLAKFVARKWAREEIRNARAPWHYIYRVRDTYKKDALIYSVSYIRLYRGKNVQS